MKKLLVLLLALTMLFSVATLFTGCEFDSERSSYYDDEEEDDEEDEDDKDKDDEDEDDEDDDDEPEPTAVDLDELEHEDLAYVLIYNPQIYDENARNDKSALNTGYLGNQIEVDANRGDGLETEENPYKFISQSDKNNIIPWDSLTFEEDRVGSLGMVYSEGDKETFYYEDGGSCSADFTCVYEGEYCYVWTDETGKESAIIEYGEIFDEEIYEEVAEKFGDTDMVDETGKINILFHPLSGGCMGYFWLVELCSEKEISKSEASAHGANLNHAMIHINSELTWSKNHEVSTKATLAHEFQHLIAGTDVFKTIGEVNYGTWLNEAMSGWIEEVLYTGAKEHDGHYTSFMNSNRIRRGQSMYNFDSGYDSETKRYDIGVYGSVYLFAEYLAMEAGDDVFSDIHEYWRTSYSDTLCDAEAIYNAVPKKLIETLNKVIIYSDSVDFDSKEEKFMSKLILSFYLEVLNEDTNAKNFDEITKSDLLYDNLEDAKIEGGGRIIVAVKDDSFEIPDDADPGLVYVGLDKDFNVITPIVCK